jgi:lipid II:glycine glycyltransferase (peptidoglycan interpeptide bridge formation enzyme)
MSPFWERTAETDAAFKALGAVDSPLHLLAEHLWMLPLHGQTEENLMGNMRPTTRNLIRRAQKEGVTVTASDDPVRDLPMFLHLHEQTRKRHRFTPYTDAFFRAQVEAFAKTGHVTLYLARHGGEVIASSIHMLFGGETSYHHGASALSKIPASYLLQWTAIVDALKRGDRLYNFWGIAPGVMENGKWKMENPHHPFAGVTLFKMGFGGRLLELTHCRDVPLSSRYIVTRVFERWRKWRRGF